MASKKILVADDDPSIVDALQLMLELEGYEVQTVSNGGALYEIDDVGADLFLLDIWMAGHDGRDICRHLKQNPATRDIPVIMISAGREMLRSAYEAGADDFVAKPFDRRVLLEIIGQQLRRKS